MKGGFFVMKNVVEVMISSSKELKSVRNLVLASLLITVHLLWIYSQFNYYQRFI